MRIAILFSLIFISNLSVGQSIEQKAVDYLIDNIEGLNIKYENGQFNFNKDSNSVWYSDGIIGKSKGDKVKIINGKLYSIDNFYKIIHNKKDIYIITNACVNKDDELLVKFNILTNYDNRTDCMVIFNQNRIPIKLTQN